MAGKYDSVLKTRQEMPPEPDDAQAQPKRGRPAGRRSDPAFVQTSIYIPREVHAGVMLALTQAKYTGVGNETDFSDLAGRLLAEWLHKHQSK